MVPQSLFNKSLSYIHSISFLFVVNFILNLTGGFISGAAPSTLIRDGIVHLCSVLKDDAVSLADVIAPCDFVLNSALGMSDGKVCISTPV